MRGPICNCGTGSGLIVHVYFMTWSYSVLWGNSYCTSNYYYEYYIVAKPAPFLSLKHANF